MSISVKKVEDGVTVRLNNMLGRIAGLQSYLNTVVYKQYQDAQIKRWETEGSSEQKRKWKRLTPVYLKRKLIKYAAAPYGGRRIGIAGGDLVQSVVGSNKRFHRKIVTKTQLIIGTSIKYAGHFAEERPIFEFGKDTKKEIRDGILTFLRGKKRA